MKSSPFHVKLIFGLIFALFKTDSSSLKIDVALCSKGCKVNNSVCDNTGKCICKSGWYGDKCNYTNDCKLYKNDLNYNGNISVVKNGFLCLFWNNVTHKQFPMMQHNYCRTPSGDPEVIPWCYIKAIDRYWDHCDIPVCVCEPGKFGENCKNICHCKTPGCNVTNGICNVLGCEDGWSGSRCDKCEGNRFGNNCEQICHCKTPGCNDMTGRCVYSRCSEGWTGDSCSVCMSNRFGPECKIHCHCEVGGCDNMTGVCYEPGCATGWTGASCNNICMSNRFGPDCKIHCHCELGGCDNMTGVCYEPGCATGWTGASCNYSLEKSEPQTTTVERDGIVMSYGLFGGVLTSIIVISAGVYIGACFYHRRRIRKHITIYEDLQLKSGQSEQRQTVTNDDTYYELQ